MSSENHYLRLVRQDCPLPPGTHVVIYCRDSGGEEQDRSVQQQVEAIQAYCNHHHLVIEERYIDEARQSTNTEKRDHLNRMLTDLHSRFKRIHDRYKREKYAEKYPFGVIFWKSNRLGRDSTHAVNIKSDLRLRGVTIIDLVTGANTGNAGVDNIIEAVQVTHDEMVIEDISATSKRGLAQLVGKLDTDPTFLSFNPGWKSTGGYLGCMPGGAPRGFKGERVRIGTYERKKGRKSGEPHIVQRLVPDPELWDRCKLAWQMRYEGASITEIHRVTRLYKNVNGYDTFFDNRIYTGDLIYGGELYEKFVPAMIPREWFDEIQRRKVQHAAKQQGKPVAPAVEPASIGSEYLLSGLVVCGVKGDEEHPMHIESIPGEKGVRGNYIYFICTTMKNTRKVSCDARRLSMRALENTIIHLLMDRILTADNLRPLAAEIRKALKDTSGEAGTRIAALEAQLHEVRKAIDNVMDAIEKMGYAPQLQQRYDVRRQEEETLLHELNMLKALRVKPLQLAKLDDGAMDGWIEQIRAVLMGADRQAARRAIQQFVAKIVIKEKTGMLFYTFPFPDELYMPSFGQVDLRDYVSSPSQTRRFVVGMSGYKRTMQRRSDKQALLNEVLVLHQAGLSLREIAEQVGLHWTRIGQIIRAFQPPSPAT